MAADGSIDLITASTGYSDEAHPSAVVKYPINKAANDEVTLYPLGKHVGVTWLFSGNVIAPPVGYAVLSLQ